MEYNLFLKRGGKKKFKFREMENSLMGIPKEESEWERGNG